MPERVILCIGTKKGLFVAEAPKTRRSFLHPYRVAGRFHVRLIYRVLAADQWRALVGQPAEAP